MTNPEDSLPNETILIAGATGDVASYLIKHLLASSRNHTLRLLCRNPSKISKEVSSHPSVTVIKCEYWDLPTITTSVQGCTSVICAYAARQLLIEGQLLLLSAADAAGVPRFFFASWNLDYRKLSLGTMPVYDPMIIAANQIHHCKTTKGVWVLTGGFYEYITGIGVKTSVSGWDREKKELTYWGSGEEPWPMTAMTDAAAYTVAIIERGSEEHGWYRIAGEEIGFKEVAKKSIQLEGGKEEEIGLRCLGTNEECKALIDKKEKELGWTEPNLWTYMGLYYAYYCNMGTVCFHGEIDNGKFPEVQFKGLQEWLGDMGVGKEEGKGGLVSN